MVAAALASRKTRKRLARWGLLALMVVVAIVMLYPFWYMVDNAFRSGAEFDRQSGHSLAGWRQLFAEPAGSQPDDQLGTGLRGGDRDHPDCLDHLGVRFRQAALPRQRDGLPARRLGTDGAAAVDPHPRVREPGEGST